MKNKVQEIKEYVEPVKLDYDFKDYLVEREMISTYELYVCESSYQRLLKIQKILETLNSFGDVEKYNKLKQYEKYVMCVYLNTHNK